VISGLRVFAEEAKESCAEGFPRTAAAADPPAPATAPGTFASPRGEAPQEALRAIRQDIGDCRRCKLAGGRTHIVFGVGNPESDLMFVGEGPGEDEDRKGEPFVGRAGQLLDRMLGAAGLSERVLITNSVFWRPPGNRDPTPAEQDVCRPFLERAIALIRPRVLLLVGAPSSKSMLKTEQGILSLRGRWHDWRSADGALELPALPTLHPAFLLRQPAAKKQAWADLLTLAERLDQPE